MRLVHHTEPDGVASDMDLRTVVRSEFSKPKERFRKMEAEETQAWKEPKPKRFQPTETRPNLKSAHNDEELRAVLRGADGRPTVVDFGASWCEHCKGMLPWFAESSGKVGVRSSLARTRWRGPRTTTDGSLAVGNAVSKHDVRHGRRGSHA